MLLVVCVRVTVRNCHDTDDADSMPCDTLLRATRTCVTFGFRGSPEKRSLRQHLFRCVHVSLHSLFYVLSFAYKPSAVRERTPTNTETLLVTNMALIPTYVLLAIIMYMQY